MQQYKCPKCGSPITYGAPSCNSCGQPFRWQHQPQPPPQQFVQTPQYQQQYQQSEIASQQQEESKFTQYEAKLGEDLYLEERNQAGKKDLMWGFIWLGVGALITLGTLAVAEPGGTYWVMRGLILVGGFYILRGLYRKITSTINTGTRLAWILGGTLLICSLVGGGMTATYMISSSKFPSESFILLDDTTAWVDEVNGIVEVVGTITNTHSEWSIKDVYVELETTDAGDKVVETFRISVVPDQLGPGGEGVYSETIEVPLSCTAVEPVVHWVWEPP